MEFILFFSPPQKKERNPNPHCSTFPSPHEPTLCPKACKRAAISEPHNCYDNTFITLLKKRIKKFCIDKIFLSLYRKTKLVQIVYR